MSQVNFIARLWTLAAVTTLLCHSHASAAPFLETTVLSPYQVGTGAGVNLGHVVHASTVYTRLVAGGGFSAECAHPDMLPATGARTVSESNLLVGGISLHVTIPLSLPAYVNMPGFYSLSRGTTVNCTYNWNSRAVESGFTIGAGGITYQTGNGESSQGSYRPFIMRMPGDPDGDGNNVCIP